MFGGNKQQKGGSSYSFSSSNVTIDNKHPVTERADSLSMSGSPPLQRPNFVEEEVVQEKEDVLVVKMKQKLLLLKQELKAKDDMLEAVQSQAKLDIVNARTRVDSIEEKREELEARCAKAEKLALERTNALETANKKLKEAERSAKVFMQRANAKISEALRENDSADQGPSPSSSSSKVERKMTPSNLSLQEKILRIERQQQMEDEEGLLKKNSNSNTKKKKKNNKEESSSSLVAVNNDDDEVEEEEEEEEEEENKEEETKSEKQSVEEVEALRWEIQQLLTQNADAARSFQNSLEIERNKRREAEERAEISEATCVRLQSELKSKESLLKMMEKNVIDVDDENHNQHLVDSKFDDAEEEDSDEDEIPLFSSPPVLKSPIPPLVSRK
ncbi:unnamed protein product [Bathycoccus prasinos]